jgi:hypothetical protein
MVRIEFKRVALTGLGNQPAIEAIKIFDLVPGPALITISLNIARL